MLFFIGVIFHCFYLKINIYLDLLKLYPESTKTYVVGFAKMDTLYRC